MTKIADSLKSSPLKQIALTRLPCTKNKYILSTKNNKDLTRLLQIRKIVKRVIKA